MERIYKILMLSGLAVIFFVLLNPCKANYWRELVELTLKIHQHPDDAWAYYNRAVIRRECGDNSRAIADLTQAIVINSHRLNTPSRANGYYQRGRLYEREENTQQAIADLQTAADIYQEQGDTYRSEYTLDEIKRIQQQSSP